MRKIRITDKPDSILLGRDDIFTLATHRVETVEQQLYVFACIAVMVGKNIDLDLGPEAFEISDERSRIAYACDSENGVCLKQPVKDTGKPLPCRGNRGTGLL